MVKRRYSEPELSLLDDFQSPKSRRFEGQNFKYSDPRSTVLVAKVITLTVSPSIFLSLIVEVHSLTILSGILTNSLDILSLKQSASNFVLHVSERAKFMGIEYIDEDFPDASYNEVIKSFIDRYFAQVARFPQAQYNGFLEHCIEKHNNSTFFSFGVISTSSSPSSSSPVPWSSLQSLVQGKSGSGHCVNIVSGSKIPSFLDPHTLPEKDWWPLYVLAARLEGRNYSLVPPSRFNRINSMETIPSTVATPSPLVENVSSYEILQSIQHPYVSSSFLQNL
jgi:hypothetical protein